MKIANVGMWILALVVVLSSSTGQAQENKKTTHRKTRTLTGCLHKGNFSGSTGVCNDFLTGTLINVDPPPACLNCIRAYLPQSISSFGKEIGDRFGMALNKNRSMKLARIISAAILVLNFIYLSCW